MKTDDLLIVGGGLVGLATAYHYLQIFPDSKLTLLEKEHAIGLHQSGRNSGVLHSGIYYKTGSLRAKMCLAGKANMETFCKTEGIDFDICGKVIVAKDASELPQLDKIYERGVANGVRCRLIGQEQLLEIEPHVRGIRAIYVENAGIINYPAVAQKLSEKIQAMGGEIILNAPVTSIKTLKNEVVVQSTLGEFIAARLVTCAGLHSDRLAQMSNGQTPNVKIVPFRGEYFQLKPQSQHLCRGLIYPVPDPRFPFLGVHFTKMIQGGVDCGPNAVLAFAREGYNKRDFNRQDLWETIAYRGFQKLAFKYWQQGLTEMWRSYNQNAFVKELQKLIPAITKDDLEPHPAGVRAMAITPDGEMLDDFAFLESDRCLHVVNAPSPAATASLAIGAHIVEKVTNRASNKQ
jgi:L-2-hydroxyglutarate oxidase LhgO